MLEVEAGVFDLLNMTYHFTTTSEQPEAKTLVKLKNKYLTTKLSFTDFSPMSS